MSYEVVSSVNMSGDRAWIHSVSTRPNTYVFYDLPSIRHQLRKRDPKYVSLVNSRNTKDAVNLLGSNFGAIKRPTRELMSSIARPTISMKREDRITSFPAVVSVPISVAEEEPESLRPAFTALAEGAEKLNEGPVLTVVYMNYDSPGDRNRRSERDQLEEKAMAMGGIILDNAKGSNLFLQTFIDEEKPNTIWPQRRNRMAYIALARLDSELSSADFWRVAKTNTKGKWEYIYNRPYIELDVDTIIGDTALEVLSETVADNRAIMVNGTLHYTGGIMDKPPQEVAKESNIGIKILYFAEMMRRHMFDHLNPISLRGYISETGLTKKLGVLGNLGFYDETDPQNESFYLEVKAVEAWMRRMGVEILTPRYTEPRYQEPYLATNFTYDVDGTIYYAPRHEYAVDTSGRALEKMVSKYGPESLVDWDQGPNYEAYGSEGGSQKSRPVGDVNSRLSINEITALINRIHSAFENRGGYLRKEDLWDGEHRDLAVLGRMPLEKMTLVDLFKLLFSDSSKEQVVFWYPKFAEQRN